MGKNHASAIGTLMERTTRCTMLLHLPGDQKAVTVRDTVVTKRTTLPEELRGSLAWDQGIAMANQRRGTSENTNGGCSNTSTKTLTCRFTQPKTCDGPRTN